jgi:hypothetical protein
METRRFVMETKITAWSAGWLETSTVCLAKLATGQIKKKQKKPNLLLYH